MSAFTATTPIQAAIAITGVGAVSAAGAGAAALREAQRAGRSHLGAIPRLESARLPLAVGGAVPDGALRGPPAAPGDHRLLAMCSLAAAEALAQGGLAGGTAGGPVSLALGTALGEVEALEALVYQELEDRAAGPRAESVSKNRPAAGVRRPSGAEEAEAARRGRRGGGSASHTIKETQSPSNYCSGSESLARAVVHHDLTQRLGERLGLSGPRATFSMTCASGLCALEQAAADLRLGRARAALAGGADLLSRFMQAGFSSLKALSPSGRLRPFEESHDGLVLGEGAAFVLLETGEGARLRGTRILGVVAGNRLLSDAAHLTSPDESGAGMARAIGLALGEAGLAPGDVGGVTFTATGSPVYDRMQSRALRSALGPAAERVPVTTWEPAIGHALASTSILGLVHAVQCLEEGVLLPVASGGQLDPALGLRYLRDGPAPLERPAILALTVGFGGQNGASVVVRAEGRC